MKPIPSKPNLTYLVEGKAPSPEMVWWGEDRVPIGFDPRWISADVQPVWITEEEEKRLFPAGWKPFTELVDDHHE